MLSPITVKFHHLFVCKQRTIVTFFSELATHDNSTHFYSLLEGRSNQLTAKLSYYKYTNIQ